MPVDGSTDMTSVPTIVAPKPHVDPVDEPSQARLQLKSQGSVTGHVDGAWWPRSRDLAAELPELLTEIAPRMEPVGRVSYRASDWDPAPRKLTLGSHVVRLGWYRLLPSDTVDVISGLRRLTLVVVPPETPADTARAVLDRAGGAENTDEVATLLATRSASTVQQDRTREERA